MKIILKNHIKLKCKYAPISSPCKSYISNYLNDFNTFTGVSCFDFCSKFMKIVSQQIVGEKDQNKLHKNAPKL